MENFVVDLHHKLSSGSNILIKDDPTFASALERWTDIDRKTPELVVQPINEQDVITAVSFFLTLVSNYGLLNELIHRSVLLAGKRSPRSRYCVYASHRRTQPLVYDRTWHDH